MNTTKTRVAANAASGKTASVFGYICGAIGVIAFINKITSPSDSSEIGAIVLFLALGAFLIFKGIQIKQRIKRFKRYISLISNQRMTSLDNIAAATSQSVDFVGKDLQKMIDKQFFTNASINDITHEIVVGNIPASVPVNASVPPYTQPAQAQPSLQPEWETHTCAGCGASITKMKGTSGVCDYCGSMIQ